MRARIGIALGLYWGGVAQAVNIIAAISALGAIGGLPAILNALTKYASFVMRQLPGLRSTLCAMRHGSPCN